MTVNLKSSYAKLNEKIAGAFDSLGVRRSFTAPYTEGHSMADHIKDVGAIADQHGGLATNLLSSFHHSGAGKKGWGSGQGETVGHPVAKLQTTIIPKDSDAAKEAISAAQSHLNGFKELLGKDDSEYQTAQNQLNLVKRTDGAGMNLFDFGVMLQQLQFNLTQKVARNYTLANANTPASEMESGLGHAQPEKGPEEAQGGGGDGQETAPGEAQAAPQGSEAAPAQTAQAAPPSAAQPASQPAPAAQQA